MQKYVCDVCGYVYDPAEGDPEGGVDAGTAFEDVPTDWICPICGAPKSEFSKEDQSHPVDVIDKKRSYKEYGL